MGRNFLIFFIKRAAWNKDFAGGFFSQKENNRPDLSIWNSKIDTQFNVSLKFSCEQLRKYLKYRIYSCIEFLWPFLCKNRSPYTQIIFDEAENDAFSVTGCNICRYIFSGGAKIHAIKKFRCRAIHEFSLLTSIYGILSLNAVNIIFFP